MKIENIIEDIIQDVVDIKHLLEAKIKYENPQWDFRIDLPDIEKLSAIKALELSVKDKDEVYSFRVEIHTQNGNRVFGNNLPATPYMHNPDKDCSHPVQEWFISTLREIIKKRKSQLRSIIKPVDQYVEENSYQAC